MRWRVTKIEIHEEQIVIVLFRPSQDVTRSGAAPRSLYHLALSIACPRGTEKIFLAEPPAHRPEAYKEQASELTSSH